MTELELMGNGMRRKIGLHAWNGGEVENLAERYQVAAQTVRDCKHSTQSLHTRLSASHGPRYWANWDLEHKPEGAFVALGIGPTVEEAARAEEARRRKRQ